MRIRQLIIAQIKLLESQLEDLKEILHMIDSFKIQNDKTVKKCSICSKKTLKYSVISNKWECKNCS